MRAKPSNSVPVQRAGFSGKNPSKHVPNEKAATIAELTPAATTGTLTIPVGRVRKMNLGDDYLTAFTVGDQLLWGAAEPVRRMLKIALEHIG